jgi:hypothetical protein
VGQKLSFFEFGQEQSVQALRGPALLLFDTVWCGLLVMCLAVFLHWVAESAEGWLPLAATRPSPRPFYRVGFVVASGVLAVLLSIFYLAYLPRVGDPVLEYVTMTFRQYGMAPPVTDTARTMWLIAAIVAGLILNPLTTFALTALWVYPLAASAARRTATIPTWGILDAQPTQQLSYVATPRPRRWLIIGISGALAYGVVAMLAWSIFLRAGGAVLMSPMLIGLPVLSMLVQALVALTGGIWAADLRLAHGLGAASIAGLFAGLCTSLPFWLLGVLPLSSALATAAVVVNGGGLAALGVAFGTATAANAVRRWRAA